MNKRYDLGIDRFQAATFLLAVRAKRDIIILWMNAIKAFLANQPISEGQPEARLSIVVKSMSRLFCEINGGRKIFSVAFPFTVTNLEGEFIFFSREGVRVDSRVSSQIVALIDGTDAGVLDTPDFSKFIDPVIEAVDVDPALWTLLRELMLAEDAYVRYDWDEERANGHLHPKHHIDIHYSTGGSFKLGLHGHIDGDVLIEILDVDVDCHYLRAAVDGQ